MVTNAKNNIKERVIKAASEALTDHQCVTIVDVLDRASREI